METQNCFFGETCKYFHPKGVKDLKVFHDTNVHKSNKLRIPNNPYSYVQIVMKPMNLLTQSHNQGSFLKKNPHLHQPVIAQAY